MSHFLSNFFDSLFSEKKFPLLLLLICFFAYGLMIPWLGFYWDDLPYVWFTHVGGANGVFRAIAADRPTLAPLYALTHSILGEHPLAWQLFSVLIRWINVLSIYLLLRLLFPKQRRLNIVVSLLYLVYPGFSQQWISVIYSHAFIILSIYTLSHIFMIQAVRVPKRNLLYTILSLILSFYCLTAMEYTFGLEFIRPIILWFTHSQNGEILSHKERLKKIANRWLPYLIVLIVFIVYRAIFANSVIYDVRIYDELEKKPLGLIANFFQSIIKNLINSGMLAWVKPLSSILNQDLSTNVNRLSTFLLILLSFVFLFYFLNLNSLDNQRKITDKKHIHFYRLISFIGIFILLSAGIPFFVVQLDLQLHFPYDRFTLSMMLGACLFISGIIFWFIRSKFIQSMTLALLMSTSIFMQFQNANTYRLEWKEFRDYFWQLNWRIPQVDPDTMFLTDEMPFLYYSDNSLTAPLNWMYSPSKLPERMPYILFFTKARLGYRIPRLEPDIPINQYYRITSFQGNTSQTIVFQYSPPGCLHIFDPSIDQWNPTLPQDLKEAIPLSNLSLISSIESNNLIQSQAIFGAEPTHNWCYYYQKAALNQQQGNWEKVAELGDIAFELNDYPNDPVERLPFIEGYAHVGQWEKAIELSRKTIEISPLYQDITCALWNRILLEIPETNTPTTILNFLNNELNCDTG